MGTVKIPFFRIWYSTAFVTLFLVTLGLTLISPGDIVYQLIRKKQIGNIFSVGGVYLVTGLVWVFIWSKRIYTNKIFLRDIPKSYIPIEPGDVPRRVRKLIEKQWQRSAVIAWDSRPRDITDELATEHGETHKHRRFVHRKHHKHINILPAKTTMKVWGHIEHAGWSTPSDSLSTKRQSVQYWTVVIELPNLLEAKAVSLAPLVAVHGEEDQPDARLVDILQRPSGMGLRDYVFYLVSIYVLQASEQVEEFITQYEAARFSGRALSAAQFEQLTTSFGVVLSQMSLDMDKISTLVDDLDLENTSSLPYTVDSEGEDSFEPNRPSLDSNLTGSVRRHFPGVGVDSPSALSQVSVLVHTPRLSFSDR